MHPFEEDIKKCVSVLEAGGVVLYPTDTVWGLGCDATNAAAVSKIFTIKKRADSKAMIVLVTGERDILQYTASVDLSLFDYLETTTRPTSVIYEHGIGFADNLTAADGSIAIRICGDEFCRALIKRFGKPIVSTSANISGEATPAHFNAISDTIKKQADFVVHHRRNDQTPHQPSSIIRWKDGEVEVIR